MSSPDRKPEVGSLLYHTMVKVYVGPASEKCKKMVCPYNKVLEHRSDILCEADQWTVRLPKDSQLIRRCMNDVIPLSVPDVTFVATRVSMNYVRLVYAWITEETISI